MFTKQVLIDGKGHLLGRLASYVAKTLLSGTRIVVVRAEGINISGSLFRNKTTMHEFLRKRRVHNPRKGFVHYKSPSRIFWRVVRGMLPRFTARGAVALGKLKVFEGVPSPYDVQKKQVVPDALKVIRLKNFRKYCTLGDLAQEIGWSKKSLVEQLEQKRLNRASAWHKKSIETENARRTALNLPEINKIRAQLAQLGY